MAFCINCGTQNIEAAKFCQKCGEEINKNISFTSKFEESILLNGSIINADGEIKFGKVDVSGNWIIPPKYDFISEYDSDGLFHVKIINGYRPLYGIINSQNELVIQPIFDFLGDFDSKGYCKVQSKMII